MRTTVDLDGLLRSCIHCGLCLNDCPTYRMTGDELHSPRGRLVVLRQILAPDPDSEWDPGREAIDLCLGCRGCETACPSGVPFGALLAEGRSRLPDPTARHARMVRLFVRHVIPRRRVLALVAACGRAVAASRMATGSLERLLSTLPRRRPSWPRLRGPRTGDVAILAGCAQPVFTPGVLPATVRLVRAAGDRPFVPARQGCCGALAAHVGDLESARESARRAVRAFEPATSIVIPSAGCAAHFKELGELLADDPEYGPRARALAERSLDLVEWLQRNRSRLRFREDARRVVFQRPCHLRHAQGIDGMAEEVLEGLAGIEVLGAPRPDLCCGAAGSWSMEHPELARRRRDEKLDDLCADGPDLILTANPGCELFLDAAARGIGVRHIAEYLADLLPRGG